MLWSPVLTATCEGSREDGQLEEDSKSTRGTGAQHTDLQVVGRAFYVLPVGLWSALH